MQEVNRKGLRRRVDKDRVSLVLVTPKNEDHMRTVGPPLYEVERAGYSVYHCVQTSGDLSIRIEFYHRGLLEHVATGYQPSKELFSIIKRIEEGSESVKTNKDESFEETETKQTEGEN